MSVASVGEMLTRHRDWRVDLGALQESLVFIIGDPEFALGPVALGSERGREYAPVFEALSRAIGVHLQSESAVPSLSRRQPAETIRRFALEVDGVRFRVQHVHGQRYHIRITSDLREAAELGLSGAVAEELFGPRLSSGGLVIVCGNYGSGKTSAVNAAIRQRIRLYGGYALVMGDPIEYRYGGHHGTNSRPGYVEQVDLQGRDLMAEVRASMRNFPSGGVSMLGWPELIGSEGVGELLRASTRGSLVFADMHALSIEAAIANILALASQDGESAGRVLLSQSIRLIVHLGSPTAVTGYRAMPRLQVFGTRERTVLGDESISLGNALRAITSREGQAG